MLNKISSVKGMVDILPDRTPLWQYVEATVAELLNSYGYREIRFPLLEQTELFKRGIGEVTDIVEKEMYTFEDRNGLSLTLRPEGTASCVRACEEHGLLYNQTQKLWYWGPMFRYEKPQKGRQRQFHQFGVEAFGMVGPDIDAELMMLSAQLWKVLGIDRSVNLQINNLGTAEARAHYKSDLVSYLSAYAEQLDEDSRRRLHSNPLRILDSKVEQTQALLAEAPSMLDYLNSDSQEHFTQLRRLLDAAGIEYQVNPRLVRGLDYYSDTVFEWVTTDLGAQGTVCAGGRYDGLVAQLGGRSTPAVGWGMGIERLVLLIEQLQVVPADVNANADLYVVAVGGGDVQEKAFLLSTQLRSEFPHLRTMMHMGGGSFKSQLKKADKSGAALALILGEEEVAADVVGVKPLRSGEEQIRVVTAEVTSAVKQIMD